MKVMRILFADLFLTFIKINLCDVEVVSLDAKGSSAVFENFTMTHQFIDGSHILNVNSYMKKQIETGYHVVTVKVVRSKKSHECGEKIYENRFNLCQILKYLKTSILNEIMMRDAMKSVKFDLNCPFKPGFYNVVNHSIKLPAIMPAPAGRYCLESAVFGRRKNVKKMEQTVKVLTKFLIK